MKVKDIVKSDKHKAFQEKILPKIIPSVESLQQKLRNHEPIELIMTKHSKYRESKRHISYRTILEAIKTGVVIEYQGNENKRNEIEECKDLEPSNEECINVILMAKFGNGRDAQYVHVCLNIQGESIVVKTVYDPKSRMWQWRNGYKERLFYKESNPERKGGYHDKFTKIKKGGLPCPKKSGLTTNKLRKRGTQKGTSDYSRNTI